MANTASSTRVSAKAFEEPAVGGGTDEDGVEVEVGLEEALHLLRREALVAGGFSSSSTQGHNGVHKRLQRHHILLP